MRNADDVLVLCYHAISDGWDHSLAVRPEALARQVSLLLAHGYAPTTFTRAVHDPPPGRALAVTFDDACVSVLTRAKPVLDALGVPATVFAPSAWIGSDAPMSWPGLDAVARGRHADELRCLDWDGLRELGHAGWEVGSHTVHHPHLTRLGDRELDAELRRSRDVLEAGLATAVTSVAYPYGDSDARVDAAAALVGYAAGAGLPSRPETPSTMCWPRVGVYRKDTPARFRMKTSPDVRLGRRVVAR